MTDLKAEMERGAYEHYLEVCQHCPVMDISVDPPVPFPAKKSQTQRAFIAGFCKALEVLGVPMDAEILGINKGEVWWQCYSTGEISMPEYDEKETGYEPTSDDDQLDEGIITRKATLIVHGESK